MTKDSLTHGTPDCNGDLPDLTLVGTTWRHSKNGHRYVIVGFTWGGDTDEWTVQFVRGDQVVYCSRTLRNFFGRREDKPRFIRCGAGEELSRRLHT